MSHQLKNINIGSLKTKVSRPTTVSLSTVPELPQPNLAPSLVFPELQLLQQIPAIQPFLIRDLIPDIIYIFQYEGAKAFINEFPKLENGNLSLETPIAPEQLLKVLRTQGWGAFIRTMTSQFSLSQQEIIKRIYNAGINPIIELINRADPKIPSSIIFRHPSQDVHNQTQKIELEIIKNEPEIIERDDLQCACGKRRIRTYTIQTRRADEPPTVFAQCVSCKSSWRFSAA